MNCEVGRWKNWNLSILQQSTSSSVSNERKLSLHLYTSDPKFLPAWDTYFSRKYKNNRYIDIYFHFQKDYITNCFTLYVILRCIELSLFICLFNFRNQTIPPSMPGSQLCQPLVWWRTMYILSNSTDSKLSSCLQVSQFCASVQYTVMRFDKF